MQIISTLPEFSIASVMAHHSANREEGLHISHIIKDILCRIDKKRYGGQIKLGSVSRGYLWENTLSQAFLQDVMKEKAGLGKGQKIAWQTQILHDGIHMTPDGMDLNTWELIEVKATDISSKHQLDSDRFWHWHIQVMGYCWALETDITNFYVYFMRGDYSQGPATEGIAVGRKIRFERREMAENWMMIKNHEKLMRKEGLI